MSVCTCMHIHSFVDIIVVIVVTIKSILFELECCCIFVPSSNTTPASEKKKINKTVYTMQNVHCIEIKETKKREKNASTHIRYIYICMHVRGAILCYLERTHQPTNRAFRIEHRPHDSHANVVKNMHLQHSANIDMNQ